MLELQDVGVPFVRGFRAVTNVFVRETGCGLMFSVSREDTVGAEAVASCCASFYVCLIVVLEGSFCVREGKATRKGGGYAV